MRDLALDNLNNKGWRRSVGPNRIAYPRSFIRLGRIAVRPVNRSTGFSRVVMDFNANNAPRSN